MIVPGSDTKAMIVERQEAERQARDEQPPPPSYEASGSGSSSMPLPSPSLASVAAQRMGSDYGSPSMASTSAFAQPQLSPSLSMPSPTPAHDVLPDPHGYRALHKKEKEKDAVIQCFSRQPPASLSSAAPTFDPMFLICKGKKIGHGFPSAAPPSREQPHPFASHDIWEQDWVRFVDDLRIAGKLTHKEKRHSKVPIISIIPVISQALTYGIRYYFESRKDGTVSDVVDVWNHQYFSPRRLEVILMKGIERLSGRLSYAHNTSGSNVSSTIRTTGDRKSVLAAEYGDFHSPSKQDVGAQAPGPVDSNMEKVTKVLRENGVGEKDELYRLFVVPLP